jgi:hypothetical protein
MWYFDLVYLVIWWTVAGWREPWCPARGRATAKKFFGPFYLTVFIMLAGECDRHWLKSVRSVIPRGYAGCWRARFQSSAIEMESARIPESFPFIAPRGEMPSLGQICNYKDKRVGCWLQIPSFTVYNEIMSHKLHSGNKEFRNNDK